MVFFVEKEKHPAVPKNSQGAGLSFAVCTKMTPDDSQSGENVSGMTVEQAMAKYLSTLAYVSGLSQSMNLPS